MADQKYLSGVIAGGLVGGFGSWVWATTVGPAPLIESATLAIPAYVFLGGLAGFLGVFLVAKTDPEAHVHAAAFAVACGLFWGPVISGAKAMVSLEESQDALARTQTLATQIGQESAELRDYIEGLQTGTGRPGIVTRPGIVLPGGEVATRPVPDPELQERLARIDRLQAELQNVTEIRR